MEMEKFLGIGQLLDKRAADNRDKNFLYFKNEKITYKEISDISRRVVSGYVKVGIKKGDNVCIMLPNSPEYLYAWFGLARLGAVEVPVNAAFKGDFLRHVIDDCDAKVAIVHDQYIERFKLIQQNLPKLEKLIVVGGEGATNIKFTSLPFTELLKSSEKTPEQEVGPYDVGAIMYTSGTTGNPKGVILTQGMQWNCASENVKLRELNAEDIVYSCLPLFHANAQFLTAIPCLIASASYAMGEKFSPADFWDEIRSYKATQFNFIGAMLSLIYKMPTKEDDAKHLVRLAYGAPVPKDIYWECRRRFNIRFLEPFGLTESGIIAMNFYNEPNPKLGSFGKVADGYEIRIVDNNDYEVPPGEVGEIISRTTRPNLMMAGYYKLPEKTLDASRNLWFHTGDYAFKDHDGYFYFVDRKKDYLRVGGENVSSMQVEATVNTHPHIAESAATGTRTEGGEDAMVLFLVLKPGKSLTPDEFMTWAEERLPRFAMPRYIEFLEQLPKTPTERIEKYKLKERGVSANAWDRVKVGYKLKR